MITNLLPITWFFHRDDGRHRMGLQDIVDVSRDGPSGRLLYNRIPSTKPVKKSEFFPLADTLRSESESARLNFIPL